MKGKRGFEFSFAWIFAIIIGIFILFIAIYATSKFIKSSQYEVSTVMAKQLSIIFDPLETGLASGKKTSVILNKETRIYNKCYIEGSFGKQKISLSEKTGSKWPEPGGEISITNKYIFSNDIEEGKNIYFFSKPFNFPFKISEIIFLDTDEYCFVNPPNFILDEILALQLDNMQVSYSVENCTSQSVCFNQENCDINVIGSCIGNCDSEFDEYDYGYVLKNGNSLYYAGSLIYAAIFSDYEIYECNIKRLMLRLSQISLLYKDESIFLLGRGCQTGLDSSLINLAVMAKRLNLSSDLIQIYQEVKDTDRENDATVCNLW